jgi:hypothetical protein
MFNIISAIFVDSTLAVSARDASKTKTDRMHNQKLWATSVVTIIRELLHQKRENGHEIDVLPDTPHVEDVEKLIKVSFSRADLEKVVKRNTVVCQALDNLDIDQHDHDNLSDILDPDHNGNIEVLELIEGLRRLRGDPRRGDVVSVNLMIRSLQARAEEILNEILEMRKTSV